jgi:hypothetical protein
MPFPPLRRLTWDADDIKVNVDLMCRSNQLECGSVVPPSHKVCPYIRMRFLTWRTDQNIMSDNIFRGKTK